MSHTPGPWVIGLKQENGTSVRAIATVAWCGSNASFGEMSQTISADEAHANARLIAAAPEMLEALENVAKVINDVDSPWWMIDSNKGGFDIDIIEAAIAKAKGE